VVPAFNVENSPDEFVIQPCKGVTKLLAGLPNSAASGPAASSLPSGSSINLGCDERGATAMIQVEPAKVDDTLLPRPSSRPVKSRSRRLTRYRMGSDLDVALVILYRVCAFGFLFVPFLFAISSAIFLLGCYADFVCRF
jgi:hypothetical protein